MLILALGSRSPQRGPRASPPRSPARPGSGASVRSRLVPRRCAPRGAHLRLEAGEGGPGGRLVDAVSREIVEHEQVARIRGRRAPRTRLREAHVVDEARARGSARASVRAVVRADARALEARVQRRARMVAPREGADARRPAPDACAAHGRASRARSRSSSMPDGESRLDARHRRAPSATAGRRARPRPAARAPRSAVTRAMRGLARPGRQTSAGTSSATARSSTSGSLGGASAACGRSRAETICSGPASAWIRCEDRLDEVGILREERGRVLAPLAEPLVAEREVRARLRDDLPLEADVEDRSLPRDPLAVDDVELGLLERRRDLVLDDLHAHAVADRLGPLLEGLDAPDVESHRRVELQRATAGRRLRASRT